MGPETDITSSLGDPSQCGHASLDVVQPYDQVRIYRCLDCRHTFACKCEQWYAQAADQTLRTRALHTQQNVEATLGFVERICPTCRGQLEPPFPRAQTYHNGGKFVRYWWREIEFARMRLLMQHAQDNTEDLQDLIESPPKGIYKSALNEIKQFSEHRPRPNWKDEAPSSVMSRLGIPIRHEQGVPWKRDGRRILLQLENDWVSPEEYAAQLYREENWKVLQMESRPWHVLFGTFMWLVVCDIGDPLCRMAGFGERSAYEKDEEGELIWYFRPDDFGSTGYGERRKAAIDSHVQEMLQISSDREWWFDYWLDASYELRQYLWAHHEEDIERARQIMQVMPWKQFWKCLRTLATDYWGRYLGWPDLFAWKDGKIRLIEVKWGKDTLSEDQKNWLDTNDQHYGFDVEVLKIHRDT